MNFFHKTLMASGLWLLAVGGRAQSGASFCPAIYEDSPIYVPMHPNEPNPLAGGEFSFDCKIWLDTFEVERPIFSAGFPGGDGFLSLVVTPQNRLVFSYTTEPSNRGSVENEQLTSRVISDLGVLKTGEWASVAMVHNDKRTSFWVNNEPILAHFSEGTKSGAAHIGHGIWLIGGQSEGKWKRPLPFRGQIDDARLWLGDMTDWFNLKPEMPPSTSDLEKLLIRFDMESLKNGFDADNQILENRALGAGRFLNGELAGLKTRPPSVAPADYLKRKIRPTSFLPTISETLVLAVAIFIAFFIGFIVWWTYKASPGITYFSNEPTTVGDPVPNEKQPELPIEFGQLWPGEQVEFVVQTGSPLPSWRLIVIGGQIGVALLVSREMWVHVFGLILSENEPEQIWGILKLIFMVAALLVFLWYFNQKQWDEIVHLFRGKRSVVGTSERLIVGNPEGANRTIFWEQVRSVDRDPVSPSVKFQLRTGPQPIESFVPEIFWLTNLAEADNIFLRSKELVAKRPVLHTGEAALNFYPKMTDGGPKAWFGPCELHQTLLFAAHDFFGKNQLLMLRSRIKSAVVEPYDIPKPGWAVVLFLENGARFPLFFVEDIKEAKAAAAWFK